MWKSGPPLALFPSIISDRPPKYKRMVGIFWYGLAKGGGNREKEEDTSVGFLVTL
jgi:hypothetical protein